MSKVIAHPPGDCCVKVVKHEGTPVGSTIDLGGLKSYISESKIPGTNNVIIFFSDIHGPLFVNNQLLMDYYASHGFTVISPDYFLGDWIQNHTEPSFDRMAWFMMALPRAQAVSTAWMDAVFAKFGTSNVNYSVVGYCFGASFALDLAATDKVVAAAVAHPAFLEDDHIKSIKCPVHFTCAEIDQTFPLATRRVAEDILVEKKAVYHFGVYSGVEHGFAVRGDLSVENIRWAKEDSARAILNWFTRFSGIPQEPRIQRL